MSTCRFFPLFFKEKVALSPGVTNVVMAAIPLALAPLCFVSKRVSKYLGEPTASRPTHCALQRTCPGALRGSFQRARHVWICQAE